MTFYGIGEGLCFGHPGDCQHHHGHPAGPRHLPDPQVPAHHHQNEKIISRLVQETVSS